MKSVEFENLEIKELYKNIIKEHRALAPIILKLSDDCAGLTIEKIENTEEGIWIFASKGYDDIHVSIELDLLKKKIYVQNDYLYKEVYDDIPKMFNRPIAHLYEFNGKELTDKISFKIGDKVKYYDLKENGNHYVIIIDINSSLFDVDEFVNLILYNSESYNSIRDLFLYIKESDIIPFCTIRLADSKGSNIIIENGTVKNYLEYIEDKDQYIKVYLENGEFYYERKVKEPYNDKLVTYVKEMNDNNQK